MIKLTYISVMIACLLISSHAFTFRNSQGYRDYNKKVFDAHNNVRVDPASYAKLADAQKSFFVYDKSKIIEVRYILQWSKQNLSPTKNDFKNSPYWVLIIIIIKILIK